MKPSQLVSNLRLIAAAIDNSENPSKDLVAKDLNRLIGSMVLIPDSKIDEMAKEVEEFKTKVKSGEIAKEEMQSYIELLYLKLRKQSSNIHSLRNDWRPNLSPEAEAKVARIDKLMDDIVEEFGGGDPFVGERYWDIDKVYGGYEGRPGGLGT